jgi:hypothetical protein
MTELDDIANVETKGESQTKWATILKDNEPLS